MSDTKASAFTTTSTMAGTDVFPVITGIGGTPANKIISKTDLKTDLALVKADVGLGNVDNTSDTNKPVSTAQATADALNLKIASNLSDLASASTARTNLGLGTLATQSGTFSGTSSGTNTGDQSVPTNAAGTDLDTATDTTKFATAKAIKDAHNVPSVAPGTSGNVLTSNGTDWTSAAPSGGGTAKPRLIQTDNGSSLADLAHNTFSTGVITAGSGGTGAVIERGTTATGSGFINNPRLQYIMPLYDKNPTFFLSVDDGQFSASQSYDVYMILGYAFGPSDALPAASYFKYFGFRMRNNAGTAELYSVHQDATHAEGSTSIGAGVSFGQNTHTMVADMTSGTNIKFYVDGTLLATHTTNLPAGVQAGSSLYQIAAIGKTGTTNQSMVTVNNMGISYDAY